jgi:quinohemoprotein amine dehydrogenase
MRFHIQVKRVALAFTLAARLLSQQSAPPQTAPQQGIPIYDKLTISKCGACHQRNAATGMMGRLSYIRTSPEVWQEAIKRMIRLEKVTLTPAEARDIVRYLSNNNGLAPEEMKQGFWEVEHRTVGYQDDYTPDAALQKTCNYCHNVGRILAQRRTRDDYEKLVAMHLGLFPNSANVFRPQRPKALPVVDAPARAGVAPGGGVAFEPPRASPAPADAKYPVDLAIEYLEKTQPLMTPEWASWRAAMRPAKLAGTWLLSGYQTGRGKIYGTVAISPGAADDQFETSVQFSYVASGGTVKSTGKSIVYTGYNWRGRSTSPSQPAATPSLTATAVPSAWREAMMVSRDGNTMDGRWFWSGVGELGIDVHLVRLGAEPVLLGVDLSALRSPSKNTLKIYGAKIPSGLKPADIDLGQGITVTKVSSSTPSLVTVEVEVAKGLVVGKHDLAIGRASVKEALAVYDKVAYIEIVPEANMSRLGGIKYPKEYAQFEAIAWAAGPDGKADTEDDVPLGAVSARWELQEFVSTPEDDDTKFVGALDDTGLFTPNTEGPNPNRKKQANNFPANNFGDVWVAASYKTPDGIELKAKSYLVVTIPNYTFWDQPEVAP